MSASLVQRTIRCLNALRAELAGAAASWKSDVIAGISAQGCLKHYLSNVFSPPQSPRGSIAFCPLGSAFYIQNFFASLRVLRMQMRSGIAICFVGSWNLAGAAWRAPHALPCTGASRPAECRPCVHAWQPQAPHRGSLRGCCPSIDAQAAQSASVAGCQALAAAAADVGVQPSKVGVIAKHE